MKNILLLLFCLATMNAKTQWINSLSIVPQNPIVSDSVYLIADCSFPSGSCDQHTQGLSIIGNNIHAWALHCLGMLAVICNHTDTFALGTLPAGLYNSTFQLDNGLGPAPCTAGIVPGISSSYTFTVSLSTDLSDTEKENPWVTVFPNPSSDLLHIELNSKINVFRNSLSLYNIYGKKVWESENVPSDNKFLLHTKKLASGIYMLRMGSNARKIIVNND